MNRISRFYRISAPAPAREMDEAARDKYYRRLRMQAFIAATLGYSLYYVCRTSLNVMKKPILDSGSLDASQPLSARRCCSPMPSANSSTDSSPTTATSNASWPPA